MSDVGMIIRQVEAQAERQMLPHLYPPTWAELHEAFSTLTAERDAALAEAARLREALDGLIDVAKQAVENGAATCDRMWVSDAELADMARQALAHAALAPAEKANTEGRSS